jgi:hypothetical protein
MVTITNIFWFLHCAVVICPNVLKEYATPIFRVTEPAQVEAEVVRRKKCDASEDVLRVSGLSQVQKA